MSYYRGPHSASAWLATAAFCAMLVWIESAFLGLLIGIGTTVGFSFVIFKLIGGDGGFFK